MARFFFSQIALLLRTCVIAAQMSFLDFSQLRRPKSPNTCLVAPQEVVTRARIDRPPPEFGCTPQTLFERLETFVRTERRVRDIRIDADQRVLAFVAVSGFLKFKDDVDVRVLEVPNAPDRSTIAVYSRSRTGHSDLGVNARRVERMLKALEKPLP
jgi:uncharacterized protein (DUF1499 family)